MVRRPDRRRRRRRSARSPRRTWSCTRPARRRGRRLSIYDAGEGQLAEDFPTTFCSLIYGSDEGSYKGAVPVRAGPLQHGRHRRAAVLRRRPQDAAHRLARAVRHVRRRRTSGPSRSSASSRHKSEPVVEVSRRVGRQDHDGRLRAAWPGAEDRREVGRGVRAARAQGAAAAHSSRCTTTRRRARTSAASCSGSSRNIC